MNYPIKVHSLAGLLGVKLLHTPIWNKGTAFDETERTAFGLRGLLPPHIESLKDPTASLLPNVRTLRDVAREVSYAVAGQANDEGLAPEFSQEKGRQAVAESQWTPEYSVYTV